MYFKSVVSAMYVLSVVSEMYVWSAVSADMSVASVVSVASVI